MAQIILSDVLVTLGSITLGTNGVKSVTISFNPDMKDNTGMGMTAKSRKKGLDDWSMDIEIFQDFITAGLDDDLWALVAAGTTVGAIVVRPVSGTAIGVSNPEYRSTAGIIESYAPVSAGEVGELGVAKLKILAMGATLTRHTV